jgi:glutathione S-transferase
MLLYDGRESGNCYKVRLLLHLLEIPFERVEVDVMQPRNRPKLLADKNPALRVPVLELDDGRCLAESDAILWYLAEDSQFLPEDGFEQAKVLQWMFFEQYNHEPYIAVVRHRTMTGELDAYADTEERRRRGYLALDAMERQLETSDFFVDERYSIADIALYAYTHVGAEGGFDLVRYPAIRAWLDRVAGQPGHVEIAD